MKLWFESHSTSRDNELGLASGHLDPPLSSLGRMQASEIGPRYENCGLAVIYTSDLTRAIATARIAFAGQPIPIVSDARLRECDYGDWSGRPAKEIDAAKVRFIDEPFPGGESFQDVVTRVNGVLQEIRKGRGAALIVGHRATWYSLEHMLKGRPLREVVTAPWSWQPGWEYEL